MVIGLDQAREIPPAKDRRFNHWATPPTCKPNAQPGPSRCKLWPPHFHKSLHPSWQDTDDDSRARCLVTNSDVCRYTRLLIYYLYFTKINHVQDNEFALSINGRRNDNSMQNSAKTEYVRPVEFFTYLLFTDMSRNYTASQKTPTPFIFWITRQKMNRF